MDTKKTISKRTQSHRLVLVGGCFDFIHFGHIRFLTKAKSYGDTLVVALESDASVRKMKGPTRPIHTQKQRQLMLEALDVVDEVIPLPPMHGDKDYFNLVKKIKPAVIAATAGDPIIEKKRNQAMLFGARLVIISKVRTPSTSQLAKLLGLE